MHVVGVLDLRDGRAVHARGGTRALYQPVVSVAGHPIDGDAIALARHYVERLGVSHLYVADLDAIDAGRSATTRMETPSPNIETIRAVTRLGSEVWLDAGAASSDAVQSVLALGATRAIVGLETLPSLDRFDAICRRCGAGRLVFSLDLRGGAPMHAPAAQFHAAPEAIAKRAVDAGADTIIVLDVARVGSGEGVDGELLRSIRSVVPGVTLLAGGGISTAEDAWVALERGCDGVLVATGLLSGSLTADAVARLRAWRADTQARPDSSSR